MEAKKNNPMGFDYHKSLKKRNESCLNKLIKVEKHINRPIASLIVRAVFNTRITPNGLTFLNFFLGLTGAYFISLGEYIYIVIGGALIQISGIVDCADGQLARAKDMCSPYGSHLDIFLDRIMDFVLIISMGLGAFKITDNPDLLLIGFLTAGLYLLQINLFYISNTYTRMNENGSTGEARALMLFLVFLFCMVNELEIALYLLLVETLIVNLTRISLFLRLGRKEELEKKEE